VPKSLLLISALALLSFLWTPTSNAQSGVTWSASFYNNATLSGDNVLERRDNAIAFNWGNGSPAPEVNSDNFTVRWGTDVYLPAGTYRFYALADDSVRIIVDFQYQPLINTFDQPRVGETISADIRLNEGTHHIQVDYREAAGDAYVYVSWANLATNPTGPNFPQSSVTSVTTSPVTYTGPWSAQYYGNPTLSDYPTVIESVTSPSNNWGNGSPAPSILPDNFSARFTSIQQLDSGDYRVSVRADDGVRVTVDGIVVINEFHGASGSTYTANMTLNQGLHNFMIEYYEASGAAFLDYQLLRVNPVIVAPPQPQLVPTLIPTPAPVVVGQPADTGARATVDAFILNVRNIPDATGGRVVVKINDDETYPIVGRNADSSWWQINVNGTTGWVNARFVDVSNTGAVPITDTRVSPQPTYTGYNVTAKVGVNIRSGPQPSEAILAVLPRNQTAQLVGRNVSNTWWQVSYNGALGWVNAPFVNLSPGTDLSRVPVTG
jgi:uncharacterized protein YraI